MLHEGVTLTPKHRTYWPSAEAMEFNHKLRRLHKWSYEKSIPFWEFFVDCSAYYDRLKLRMSKPDMQNPIQFLDLIINLINSSHQNTIAEFHISRRCLDEMGVFEILGR